LVTNVEPEYLDHTLTAVPTCKKLNQGYPNELDVEFAGGGGGDRKHEYLGEEIFRSRQ
jgi:hypothetical protein